MDGGFGQALETLRKLADAFGATGAISLLFGLVAFYYYRRDAREREAAACGDRAALMEAMTQTAVVIERNTSTSERLAQAVDRLAEANRESANAYTRQIDRIVDLLRYPPSQR